MQQLVADARNISHCVVDGDHEERDVVTLIEAVLTVMNRNMRFIGNGMMQEETLETLRFQTTIQGAERLQADIGKWVEDAKRERRALGFDPS